MDSLNKFNDSINSYVFFLNVNDDLPREFYLLAKALSLANITLIPVSKEDLIKLTAGKKIIIMTIVKDLLSYKKFLINRKSFLDMALMSNKISLIDINSFSPLVHSKSIRMKKYYFLGLPLRTDEIVSEVKKVVAKDGGNVKRWPGGIKGKIPTVGLG